MLDWLPDTLPVWFPEWLVYLITYTVAVTFVVGAIIILVRLCRGEEATFLKIFSVKFSNRVKALRRELNKRDVTAFILKDIIYHFVILLPCIDETENFQEEVKRLYNFILHKAPSMVPSKRGDYKRAAVFLVEEYRGKEVLKLKHGLGFTPQERSAYFEPGEGLVGLAYSRGEQIISPNVNKDSNFVKKGRPERKFYSVLCTPIMFGDKIEGVLSIDSTKKNAFPKRFKMDFEFIEILTYLLGQLVQIQKCPILSGK